MILKGWRPDDNRRSSCMSGWLRSDGHLVAVVAVVVAAVVAAVVAVVAGAAFCVLF